MDIHHDDGQYGAPLVVPQGDTLFLGGCQINNVFAVVVVKPSIYYLVSSSVQVFHCEAQAHLKSTSRKGLH